jgi:hypothetical protein
MSRQKQCVMCNKSGGIMTCDGCQQTFCGKHVIEHRQQLTNQLDGIMQEHDLLQQELTQPSDEHLLLQTIDKWERESITKINVAAEAARADLRQTIEKSKQQLSKAYHDIAVNLRSSREADDFSEYNLSQWLQQLEELKLQTKSSSSVQVIEDERSVIHLITIQDNGFAKKALKKNDSSIKDELTCVPQERFSKVIGNGKIDERGIVATHIGSEADYTHFIGEQLYSQGRQTVRFKIEQGKTPYNIFFGCISSQAIEQKIHYSSPLVVGWFGFNEIHQHGSYNTSAKDHGYRSDEVKTNDVLQLTFDCEKKQIELFQGRLNKSHTLAVNINEAPFPWQLLLLLTHPNDCVRIIP